MYLTDIKGEVCGGGSSSGGVCGGGSGMGLALGVHHVDVCVFGYTLILNLSRLASSKTSS